MEVDVRKQELGELINSLATTLINLESLKMNNVQCKGYRLALMQEIIDAIDVLTETLRLELDIPDFARIHENAFYDVGGYAEALEGFEYINKTAESLRDMSIEDIEEKIRKDRGSRKHDPLDDILK